jgi:hypothetical protein
MKKKVMIPKTVKSDGCIDCGVRLKRVEVLEAPCPYCGKQVCDACYAQHHFTCLDNHPEGGHIESEEWGYHGYYETDKHGIFSSKQGALDDAKSRDEYQKVTVGKIKYLDASAYVEMALDTDYLVEHLNDELANSHEFENPVVFSLLPGGEEALRKLVARWARQYVTAGKAWVLSDGAQEVEL